MALVEISTRTNDNKSTVVMSPHTSSVRSIAYNAHEEINRTIYDVYIFIFSLKYQKILYFCKL